MAFTITMPNKQFKFIEGNQNLSGKIVAEVGTSVFYDSVSTKLKLTDFLGAPKNFNEVFETITAKNTYNEYTMDVLDAVPDATEVEINTAYALTEDTSEIYEINFTIKPDYLGLVNLTLETTDVNSSNTISESAIITSVTLMDALTQYEELVVALSKSEVDEIEANYADLESKRVLVQAAISGLEDSENKTTLMNRYWGAASNQYTAYKLLLLHLSATNRIELVSVKNVGGNYPYQLAFRDKILVGSATEVVRFYPEGYKAEQTGNPLFPSDFPEDISSAVTVGQDKVLIEAGTNFIKTGDFLQLYKINGVWYRLPFKISDVEKEVEEAPTTVRELTSVDGYIVSISENGNEFLTPTEQDMRDAISKVSFTGSLATSQDAEVPLVLTSSLAHPIYGSNVRDSFKIDYLVTSTIPFPANSSIEVALNGLNLGNVPLTEGGTSFYLSELGLAGVTQDQLNFRTGTDTLEFKFEGLKPGTIQLSVRAVVAEAGEHKIESSLYDFGLYTAQTQLLDRKGALEHAIANTSLELTGDTIETIEEGIILNMTATYPEFHAELDPELKVDTLFNFDKVVNAGGKIDIHLDDISVGSLTVEEGSEKSQFWLSDIIENVRPALVDNNNSSVVYKVILSGFATNEYSLDTKLVAAKEGSFEIVSARSVLANVVTPLQLTDKSKLISLINNATELLVNHVEGTETGNASAVDRQALQDAINSATLVQDDDDATLNDITNSEIAITSAISTFKDSVVKITINKVELNAEIVKAQALLDTVEVGINVGQTSQEAKDALKAALDIAKDAYDTLPNFVSVFDTDDTTQAQVDQAKSDLETAIGTFNNTIVTDTQYVEARLSEYEAASLDFLNNLRKKLSI